MKSVIPRKKPLICIHSDCPSHGSSPGQDPACGARIRKRGSFRRKGSARRIARFHCLRCDRSFSQATFLPEYRQQKRELNEALTRLLVSGVSGRRLAKLMGVSRDLVARRLVFLGEQARLAHEASLSAGASLRANGVSERNPEEITLQFDEMETLEHTKLKPLSIGLVVEENSRQILGISVASMPAGGLLAELSRKKYGPRPDHRAAQASRLLGSLKPWVGSRKLTFRTDEKTVYPSWIRRHFPECQHLTHKGRRGCVVGQGELKKIERDPLFSLNHTAAMFRANVNRLFRRTWCTTKRPERLLAHLYLYLRYHNTELIRASQLSAA
jgi:transposase-like protein